MKAKNRLIVLLVGLAAWHIYLILRFLFGDPGSFGFMLHLFVTVLMDVRLAEAFAFRRKKPANAAPVIPLPKEETKYELTEEDKKWDAMWDLWVAGEMESPYAELMRYMSEVYNGGHGQYFDNTAHTGDLQKEMRELENILPPAFRENLKKAYAAELVLAENLDDEAAGDTVEQCDMMFYANDRELNRLLEERAAKIEL